MPYIKERAVPFVSVQKLLKGNRFNGRTLAIVLGCSEPTARDRLKYPGHLTLLELDKISRAGHIPMEDIRSAIVR